MYDTSEMLHEHASRSPRGCNKLLCWSAASFAVGALFGTRLVALTDPVYTAFSTTPVKAGSQEKDSSFRGDSKVGQIKIVEVNQQEDIFAFCDPLPLEGGNNYWTHPAHGKGKAVRIHQGESQICGPKVLIIGQMKCGTNTLGTLLSYHPRMKINRCKSSSSEDCNMTSFMGPEMGKHGIWEGHFLTHIRDSDPDEWLQQYAQRLPWTDGVHNITLNKAPSYINTRDHPDVVDLAKSLLPSAKIVASVCHPSLRLYSEYEHVLSRNPQKLEVHYTQHGVEPPENFTEFVNHLFMDDDSEFCQEKYPFCKNLRHNFLDHHGKYAFGLREWMDAYGKDNVLVLQMGEDEEITAKKLLAHVGETILPPNEYSWITLAQKKEKPAFKNEVYEGRESAYRDFPREIEMLNKFHEQSNQELADLLGEDFPLEWNSHWPEP